MKRFLVLIALIISGCDGGNSSSSYTPSRSSSIPPEYNADGRPNTSYERQQAVTDQMVKQGVSRSDAEATTKAIYDAEREFQRK